MTRSSLEKKKARLKELLEKTKEGSSSQSIDIDLSYIHKIADEGLKFSERTKALAEEIKEASQPIHLGLSHNQIGDEGGSCFI